MTEITLFCNPGDAYRGKPVDWVARAYTAMAIRDYDAFVTFDESYDPETPDHQRVLGAKGDRGIVFTLFAKQPIIRVGEVQGNFVSSSYLFNPDTGSENLFLPDLDVVIMGGDGAGDAAGEIKRFYELHGWNVTATGQRIPRNLVLGPDDERFTEAVSMPSPTILLTIAMQQAGYDPTRLAF